MQENVLYGSKKFYLAAARILSSTELTVISLSTRTSLR